MKKITYSFILLISISSCVVSKKKYDDLNERKSKLEVEKADCNDKVKGLLKDTTAMSSLINDLSLDKEGLIVDTAKLKYQLKSLTGKYDSLYKHADQDARYLGKMIEKTGLLNTKLDKQQKLLNEKNKDLEEKERLLKEKNNAIAEKERLLEEKNKAIAEKEALLKEKNAVLEKDEAQIDSLRKSLVDREKKLNDLENKINEQETIVNNLKNKVSKALHTFGDDELTVELKDGKVYISLADDLLFKTGSYKIDDKGKDAINKLAVAIKENQDIDIVVEGHTDDVGSSEVNWDLSVKRATSIVKVLESSGVEPKRLTASGRGEHQPKVQGETDEARGQNRRIEIIISPDLSELFNIINTNNQ